MPRKLRRRPRRSVQQEQYTLVSATALMLLVEYLAAGLPSSATYSSVLEFSSLGLMAIEDRVQVGFHVGIGSNTDGIMCTGRIIALMSEKFVSRWLRDVDPSYAAVKGRKTMISDSFDNVVDILTVEGRGTRAFSAAATFYSHGCLAS